MILLERILDSIDCALHDGDCVTASKFYATVKKIGPKSDITRPYVPLADYTS